MAQKFKVLPDGTLGITRMRPLTKNEATPKPAIKLSRLHQLLQTSKPKICFVRGEGIGDVIMTLPTVHAMKHFFNEVEIHYATNVGYLEGALVKVLQGNPDIDQIIDRDNLVETSYDLIINLHCPAIYQEKPGLNPPNRIDIFANTAGLQLLDQVPHYYITDEEVARGKVNFHRWHPDDKKILVHMNASSQDRSIDPKIISQALSDLYTKYQIRSVMLTHSSDHSSCWGGLSETEHIITRGSQIRS